MSNDNDYAVLIGINQYPSQILDNLDGPENDAIEFKDWLLLPTGGDVPDDKKHIHLILSKDFQSTTNPLLAKPTTGEVEIAFENIIDQVKDHRPARRLYIFLAGHGISPQNNLDEAALLMANADHGRLGHNIPGRLYAQWFRTAALFQEMVVLMDCCRDNVRQAQLHHPPWDIVERLDAVDVKYLYGFATKWSRKSRERAINNLGDIRGLFSHSVMTVLKSGRLTGGQLRDRVFNHLKGVLPENEFKDQEPDFDVKPEDGIMLSEAAQPAQVRISISFSTDTIGHEVEIEGGEFQSYGTHRATANPWELDLEPGKYRIRDHETELKKKFSVLEGDRVVIKF